MKANIGKSSAAAASADDDDEATSDRDIQQIIRLK